MQHSITMQVGNQEVYSATQALLGGCCGQQHVLPAAGSMQSMPCRTCPLVALAGRLDQSRPLPVNHMPAHLRQFVGFAALCIASCPCEQECPVAGSVLSQRNPAWSTAEGRRKDGRMVHCFEACLREGMALGQTRATRDAGIGCSTRGQPAATPSGL
jgi:hypothetical protein